MIFLALLLVLFVLAVYGFYRYDEGAQIVGVFGFGILLFVVGCGVGTSMDSASELDAFYLSNNDVYADAIQIYDSYAVVDESALISVASATYNDNMSDFIKEYRNSIIQYNSNLYSKRMWADNWVSGAYLVQPKHAKPIKLLKRSTDTTGSN